jgi:isopenicillin N synthase-like dioxygenase
MVIMSPLHYPPQQAAGGREISEARIGAGAHSDYGCLALLAQDERGGLQVRNAAAAGSTPTRCLERSSSTSATCSPAGPTTGLDRQSVPFFYDPNHDAPVEVIGTCLAEGEQPKYPPTTSIAHLQERFGATLPYLDETMVDQRSTDRG